MRNAAALHCAMPCQLLRTTVGLIYGYSDWTARCDTAIDNQCGSILIRHRRQSVIGGIAHAPDMAAYRC